jgi:hypothetical protein
MSALEFTEPPTFGVQGSLRLNVLLYGPPKTFKTGGAATAPGQIVMLNTDLKNASRVAHAVAGPRLQEVKLKTGEESNVIDTLSAITRLAYSETPPDTIIVDTIGDLHRRLLEELSRRAFRPTLNQYGDAAVYVERFCRSLCDAPNVNVVLVGHEWPVHNEDGSVDLMMWCGTKSSSEAMTNKLMGMVDVIGYTAVTVSEEEGRQNVAQLVTHKGRRGGDRFGALGDWQPTNLAHWVELIEAGAPEATPPLEVEAV